MNTIDVENLSVNLGGKPILKQLSLAVSEGTVCALLGPNGAGKTTLLKTLVGIYPYRNGEASILGKEVSTLKPSDFTQIGYVSESQELPDWLSISSYLSLCRKMYSNWDRDWENHLLDLLDLQKHLRQPMNKLSRGMRMKASLISSLSYKPSLLVLDEPFGGLDPVVRDDFIAAVIDLANEVNATTVVSSHDLEEVEQVADSIAFLIDGSIPLHAPLDFLLSKYRKVTVVSSDDLGPVATSLPKDWLLLTRSKDSIQFVASSFLETTFREELMQVLPDAKVVDTEEMTLKDIYKAVLKKRTDS